MSVIFDQQDGVFVKSPDKPITESTHDIFYEDKCRIKSKTHTTHNTHHAALQRVLTYGCVVHSRKGDNTPSLNVRYENI